MASTSDIKKGLCIKLNSDIFKVIEFYHDELFKTIIFKVRSSISEVDNIPFE